MCRGWKREGPGRKACGSGREREQGASRKWLGKSGEMTRYKNMQKTSVMFRILTTTLNSLQRPWRVLKPRVI